MINNSNILNKAQHIVNKIKKNSNCNADIWVASNESLVDTEFSHLIDESDAVMYAFEIAVDGNVTPYMKNQVMYLNEWLNKYNKKNGTKYTCISIFNNL